MKLRKKTTLALLLLISLVLPVLLSGCGTEKWSSFKAHGEKDVYTCTLNSTTEFWYSPTYLYGEWIKGDQTVPMTIRFTVGVGYRYETNCVLRFHDEYGSCMAELVMEMTKSRTNQSKSVCSAASELIVYDTEKEEMLESLVDGVDFVWKTIRKVEKDIPAYTPIQQSIFDFLAQGEPGFYCEDFDFWFNVNQDQYYPGHFYSYTTGIRRLQNGAWTHLDVTIEEDTLTKSAWHYSYGMYRHYLLPMICLDENGYFLRYKEGDTIHCARLERATAETDLRNQIPYCAFMSKTDEKGNPYRFVCESEGFYINGNTLTGVWTNGTDSIGIKMEEGHWARPYQIIEIYSENDETLLSATFVELLEDGSARFTVTKYSGVFPPTEIILKKELIESQN